MTKRRPYNLGKRAPAVEETKSRILAAATTEYADKGIDNTSMQAVARRADVAAGTVLYHYPTPDDLASAVVTDMVAKIAPPDPSVIDADRPLPARIRQLAAALHDFYERSGWANEIYRASPDHPALVAARREWDESLGQLIAAALGATADDSDTMRLVPIFLDADFYGLLRSRGLSQEEACDLVATLIIERATS